MFFFFFFFYYTDFVFEEGTKNETVGKVAVYGFPPHHLHHYRRYNLWCG